MRLTKTQLLEEILSHFESDGGGWYLEDANEEVTYVGNELGELLEEATAEIYRTEDTEEEDGVFGDDVSL